MVLNENEKQILIMALQEYEDQINNDLIIYSINDKGYREQLEDLLVDTKNLINKIKQTKTYV